MVPKFPSMANRMVWRVARAIVSASSQADCAEAGWFGDSFKEGVAFDALADSGGDRFASLDIKLSAALSAMVREAPSALPLLDELMLKEEAAFRDKRMIKRRLRGW